MTATKPRQPKQKFYSLTNILKSKATYNIVFGERSNGKTYAALRHGVQHYLKTGGQIGILRRWKEDITGKRAANMFAGLVANGEIEKLSGGQFTGVHYYGGKFYLCNYDPENGNPIYNDADIFGYIFAISEGEHNKSISFPHIQTIVFDEFLTKGTHLQDEFVAFMNTVSTIVRTRTDVTVFMLGNTVNTYSPYFKEMGLTNVLKMKQGEIDVYKYGESGLTVAVEYCKSSESSKPNNHYFAFDNPKLHMITGGAWELDMYPHAPIKIKPKDIKLTYFILFDDNTYQCEIVQQGDMTFTYIHRKTTELKAPDKDLIYTFEYNPKMNYSRNIYKPINKLQKRVLWYFDADRVYYQDNEVGNAISNYLKVAERG